MAYSTTGFRFDDVGQWPLARLRDPVLTGPGHGSLEDAAQAYRQLSGLLQAAADDLGAALAVARSAHEGPAAEASRQHLARLLVPGEIGSIQAAQAALALEDQATYHVHARNEMAALRDAERPMLPARVPQHSPEERVARARERAAEVAGRYQENTNFGLQTVFQAFPSPGVAAVGLAPAGGGAGLGSLAGAGGGAFGGGAVAAPAAGPPVAAPGAVPGGVPGDLPGTGTGGGTGSGAGVTAPGGVPSPGPAGRGRVRAGWPDPIPTVAPHAVSRVVPPRRAGLPDQAVPAPAADGPLAGGPPWWPTTGSGGPGSSGGWAADRGQAGAGRGPGGPGPVADGADHGRRGQSPTPGPGQARHGGPAGTGPMMPMMPGSGAGGGGSHRRPPWLVEDDPEALWLGALPPYVEPVLGVEAPDPLR